MHVSVQCKLYSYVSEEKDTFVQLDVLMPGVVDMHLDQAAGTT